ncbi:dihydrolipoyllysine-residue acetyltransferase component of pyruvate dehydrogenase complex, mitochondrial-like isoform X2 [Nilaparvata lugens]|uniref:dihydrolipoyllysine-residue acetyltransferase component of pyruvate dehydrogenase complex, mitochondrial-like isoform X2 n=1 Tax=Nilaparvata lugens TaxID=108931 RepID=UPI00193D7E2F|nr:dihydrolipoyllysine-residue acetyltransferase component of pyruvate dehydrogenase complex, mitochondrial-like isoform X2 [Nilaparvata lugens]
MIMLQNKFQSSFKVQRIFCNKQSWFILKGCKALLSVYSATKEHDNISRWAREKGAADKINENRSLARREENKAPRRVSTEKLILTNEGNEVFGPIQIEHLMKVPHSGPRIRTDYRKSSSPYNDRAISNDREELAQKFCQSKQTIPHYYLTMDINAEKLINLRKEMNANLQEGNIKLSINDFIIKATALTCLQVPEANSVWMDTFIRQYNTVDVSFIVSSKSGLTIPTIFEADSKSLADISSGIRSLTQKAKAGKLQSDFKEGTITVSNLGMMGIKQFSAFINPSQSCILAVGGLEKQLIPTHDGGSRAADLMSVTLSCDQRTVDGAVGAHWLATFRQFIEAPHLLIT